MRHGELLLLSSEVMFYHLLLLGELLLTEEDGGRSALTYVRPSSLMVVRPNPPLLEAAVDLDAKLAALAVSVTES